MPAPAGGVPAGLDGTWVAANEGYAYVFEGERYVFLVHDGISEWEFTDAGVVERSASILRLRSDDDPSWAEEHRFSLQGDVLVLDLDGSVEFRREP